MKKKMICMLLCAVIGIALAACGGKETGATSDTANQEEQNQEEQKQEQSQEKNWTISADEMQAAVEKDYGYTNDGELVNMDDENDKTHREGTWFEQDGETLVEHFVDISYDGRTNEITDISWYYEMNRSDLDYWMETLGLVIKNPEDLQFIRDKLSQDPIPAYEETEISDATLFIQNYGDDDYRVLHIGLTRK